MIHSPRCHSCDRPLSPAACFDGWCEACAVKALRGLLALRDGRAESVRARVAFLQDTDAAFLAQVVIGVLPFERAIDE